MAKSIQKNKINKTKKVESQEFDGVFVLKLTLYVIVGSLWIKITKDTGSMRFPIPVGFIIGLLFTAHEHFSIDRKIEYAVLVCAAIFGLIAPFGLNIYL